MFFTVICAVLVTIIVLLVIIEKSLDKKVIYKSLEYKHVVVTGGSSGIGKAAALEAARLGAHVTIIGRNEEKLKDTIQELVSHCGYKNNQKIRYKCLDVTSDYESIKQCFNAIEIETGPIFMLVNCAGLCICGEFVKADSSTIKQMMDLNYFGTAYPTRSVLPGMLQRNEGLLVFVSTEAALIGIYGYSAYSAAKWAVRGLAECLFMELIGTGVRLTIAFPPDTDTPGFKNEELTKPRETKLISGTGGLHSAEEVGKQMIHDALVGKTYSVFSWTGKILSLLHCSTIESCYQVITQVFTMGLLRMILVGIMMSFNKIVRDELKVKKLKS